MPVTSSSVDDATAIRNIAIVGIADLMPDSARAPGAIAWVGMGLPGVVAVAGVRIALAIGASVFQTQKEV